MKLELNWPNDFGEYVPSVDRRRTDAVVISILSNSSNVR